MALLPYLSLCESAGASVERLLTGARIAADLIDNSSAVVPMESALRLAELACRDLGTDHLGLRISLPRSLDDYGPYGQVLQWSLTVHEYLRKGIFLYNTLLSGQRIWLSEHGNELRFNVGTIGGYELGAYQSQFETMVITIKKLREAKPGWTPAKISLAYRSREALPDVGLFTGSQISRGTGETYFTIPKAMMGLRFPGRALLRESDSASLLWRSLPEDLGDLVQLQIESLLSDGLFQIDTIAESLNQSRRTLQRSLAEQGLSYSQLLTDVRVRQAVRSLESTDRPITEIAYVLGYTEAANFTRAFRRRFGVSPQAFRDNAKKAQL
jgi:AraC-like DNA-binding protein